MILKVEKTRGGSRSIDEKGIVKTEEEGQRENMGRGLRRKTVTNWKRKVRRRKGVCHENERERNHIAPWRKRYVEQVTIFGGNGKIDYVLLMAWSGYGKGLHLTN